VLLSGTALAANLCMPEFWMPPANAKKIISGSNPAAPGVTCAFLSHGTFPTQTVATTSNIPLTDRSSFLSSGTPDFDAWYKVYEGAMNNLTGDMASIFRAVCAKGADGGVNAVIVFPSEYTKGIQAFYDQKKNPLWEGGRKDGWLTGDFQQVYFTPTAFRGAVEGPPPPGKGNGVTLCATGLSAPYDEWFAEFTSPESDQIHDKYGVIASVAGKVQPGSTGFGKTGGAAVYHQHKTPKQATDFGKFIGAFLTGPDAPPSLDTSKGLYFNYGGIVADVVYPDKIPKA